MQCLNRLGWLVGSVYAEERHGLNQLAHLTRQICLKNYDINLDHGLMEFMLP